MAKVLRHAHYDMAIVPIPSKSKTGESVWFGTEVPHEALVEDDKVAAELLKYDEITEVVED